MIQLDLRSRKPIYEQIVEGFKELILKNILEDDEQMPSVRTLSTELSINPNTIQKAYKELERLGYIYSLPGKGSFVTPKEKQTFSKEIKEKKDEIKKCVKDAVYLGCKEDEIVNIVKDVFEEEGKKID